MKNRKSSLATKIKLKISDKIQLGILGAILCSILAMTISILQQEKFNWQQMEFNQSNIRPWLFVEANTDLKLPEQVMIEVKYKNVGNSPAINIKDIFRSSNSSIFPIDSIKKDLKKEKPRGIVFQGQDPISVEINMGKIGMNKDGEEVYIGDKYLIGLLKGEEMYFHIYIEYEDYSGTIYAYRKIIRFFHEGKVIRNTEYDSSIDRVK